MKTPVKTLLPCLAGLALASMTLTPTPAECQASAAPNAQPVSRKAPRKPAGQAAPAAVKQAATQAQSLPFYLEVKESTTKKLPLGLHSFAFGQADGKWLFVGGRTNGYHGTSGASSTFPSASANKKFIVYDSATGKNSILDAPDGYRQLSATNMLFVQDGDTLFVAGGYGSSCDDDKAKCYGTYDKLTAIQLKKAIAAVVAQDASKLKESVAFIQDSRFQVSGGFLRKVGSHFYLTFGHNYSGLYKDGKNGAYTERISRMKIAYDEGKNSLTVSDFEDFEDPSKKTGTESQYHRRDLIVTEGITPSGRVGLTAWGGVFTANDGAWEYPIHIEPQEEGAPQITVDTRLKQRTNLYDCAHLSMYEPGSQVMYTSLLGGITNYSHDKNGDLVSSTQENWMPFSKLITTLVRSKDGISEHVQPPERSLPGFIGANAEFVLASEMEPLRHPSAHSILDYSKLTGDKVLVGYLVGGLESNAAQSRKGRTGASNKIYEVYVVRADAARRQAEAR